MKIHDLAPYIVFSDTKLGAALEKINTNKNKIVFVTKHDGSLLGSLSDGDIRRWLLNGNHYDIHVSISHIYNKDVKYIFSNQILDVTETDFRNGKNIIPVLNDSSKILYFLTDKITGFHLGQFEISQTSEPFIIAEIGNNHQGVLDSAKNLVLAAKDAGVQCVKFQMRSMKDLYGDSFKTNKFSEDLGAQYTLDILNRFQLNDEELFEIFDFSKKHGLLPLCTPWDFASLRKLEEYNMLAYKVASADFTNLPLLSEIISTGKPLICSTGMSTEAEILQVIEFLDSKNADFVLLLCNSTYPTPYKDVNLNYLPKLRKLSGRPVGYSGHERGIHVPIAACALGAKIIEKHITLDKDQEGQDHKVSLLPNELKKMVKAIHDVNIALGDVSYQRELTQGELLNRQILAKSIFVNRNIPKGDVIRREDLLIQGPGRGLQPNFLEKVIGVRANREIRNGSEIFPEDLTNQIIKKASYNINRPFGIPVRYHDYAKLVEGTNLDFVEFHFSYTDLYLDHGKFLTPDQNMGFSVHCPELFQNDHLLDLTSSDEHYRSKSLEHLKETIEITTELKKYFPKTGKPTIIVNIGGWNRNGFLDERTKVLKYQLLQESLENVETTEVNLAIQTMPPFPWHFGGQSYHNLFVNPHEIVKFFQKNKNVSVCLDTSHTMMSCVHYGWDLFDYVRMISPYVSYLHLADSVGSDGEGVKFGEGDIDFVKLLKLLDRTCPNVPFVPEVWQGHINEGSGFWGALEFIENRSSQRH